MALGEGVAEGHIVASIDSSHQQNGVFMAQAALEQINAQVSGTRAEITTFKAAISRELEWREREINAQVNVDTAAVNMTVAEAALRAHLGQMAQAELQLATPRTALDRTGITFLVAGSVVAIVSSSGSGQSTLMNILGCLDRPTAGTSRYDGRDFGTMES